ncbi:hypothetical protein C8A05DRAFT_35588 [Staphylotrichum tortipilum]|uniref:Chromo domain-containing protein n=1 Tax=Staphylotrichum tortipilum TaxID=2831512 RepID=A0AAN6MIE9_9PEZI|nr:hypothetical protein C8A05DRAFT_35588 [Staphylotrichum longicolle]
MAVPPPKSSSPEDSATSLLDGGQPPATPGLGWETSPKSVPKRVRRFGIYPRRPFLAGLALLLVLFIAGLEILNSRSNQGHGFFISAPGGALRYLWVYGPAFVFTIVAAIWGQLEYQIQVLVPWLELARAPLPATSNLLLNYITPLAIKSFFRSLSARHYAVSLGVLGGLIAKITVIISTGLLVAETTQFSIDAEFRMADRFSLRQNYSLSSVADTGVTLWAISQGGVPYRPGATPEHAALSFFSADTAVVPVFSADQECTAFSWTYPTSYRYQDGRVEQFSLARVMPQSDLDQLSPFCVWYPFPNPSLTNNVSSMYVNQTVLVDLDCPQTGPNPPPSDTPYLFTSLGFQLPGDRSTISALLCKLRYSLTLRQVTTTSTHAAGGDVLDISSEIVEEMDLGVDSSALTYDILMSMVRYQFKLSPQDDVPFWILLMILTTPQSDWKAFANTTLLSTAFPRTFRTLAVLTAKYTKTVPETESQTVAGRIMYKHVSSGGQVPGLETLATNLRGYLFSSSPDLKTIRVQHDPQFDERQMASAKAPIPDSDDGVISKWWLPAAATKTFRISLIVTTLLLFVAPEVVYQISDKNRGFVEVSTEGNSRYLWLYLPTFSVACLSLAYGAMDTASRTLYPFSRLAKGDTGNGDAMQFDPRSSIALVAVVQTLRLRAYGLSAIILTSVLGGLLTIAASGLYSAAASVRNSQSVSLPLESWFDIRYARSPDTMYSGSVSQLDPLFNQAIQFGNLSYPAGTYGEFAFAMPDTSTLGVSNHTSNSTAVLRAAIPAAQTQANCSLYRFWDFIDLDPANSSNGFHLDVPPPPGCKKGSASPISDGRFLTLAQGAGKTPSPDYFGFVANMWWKQLPAAARPGGGFTSDTRTPYTVCSDDTQHLFIIYGRRLNLTMHNITLLHCLPFVQALTVEATFSLPSFTTLSNDNTPPPRQVSSPVPWTSPNRTLTSIPLPSLSTDDSDSLDPFFTVLTRGRNPTPLEDLTDREAVPRMLARIDAVHAQLGAQALHFNFRGPAPPESDRVEGTVEEPLPRGRARLVQTGVSTRLLEGLLIMLAGCVGVSFWVMRGVGRLVPVDPGSVAGRMGLLAGTFSDDEDASDVEMELQQQLEQQQKGKPARAARKQASYNDAADLGEDEDEEEAGEANGAADAGEGEEEDDEEGEDDGELFVVEKIMSHMINKQGKPLFEVKWEGWEKKSDRTWEPEENLMENASEVLNEYLEGIGGRAKLLEDSANALKTKKRSRASLSTPQAAATSSNGGGKRSRKNGGYQDEAEAPLSARAVAWKPPPGSWEEHVAHLDACEDEESGSLVVYLTWKNGKKTQHSTSVIYQRCPQKMLQFYERHVRIIKRDPEVDSATE